MSFGLAGYWSGLIFVKLSRLSRPQHPDAFQTTLFGFINCYKPPGMTSRDAVNVVQRRLKGLRTDDGAKVKVGHAGTLDPLAEGVLVMGVGRAVRLVPYVQQQPKHYRAKFLLGQSSESGDLEDGVQLHPDLPVPTAGQLNSAAATMVGQIQQTPPAHSAIWIDGKRAHERVRAGEVVEMPTRMVNVYSMQILNYSFPEVDVDVVCGGGTYIRTIGLDLGLAVGSTAVMAHLRREGVGSFVHTKSVSIERLREDDIEPMLLPPSMAISHMPQVAVNESESTRLGHGLSISIVNDVDESVDPDAEIAAVTEGGQIRGIVTRREGAWWPKRVFPVEVEAND
ncbi:tRNA pseudouridine synthase B [Rubripirellula tenax]|uniref:tRNA pseudouridine synthase B n=1 Tax=Rubripirellula tenax TaxID=2528015 RepID=A0A5C6FJX8_9BACT|nr:tRNA pseudouridine(55) synthase TruB [Rubripirellula tenax]TWU60367.1 tRNA pseudouridine synthase B [Rubripirellula tenax]